MWVVVSIMKDRAAALRAQEILQKEGLLVELRPVARKKGTGIYEILVLESEALEAREILAERGMA
jgi:hypothetical protein